MSDEDPTAAVERSWDAVSGAWAEHRERIFDGFRHVSEWLLAAADPQPGQAVLEVAAGTGETGFLAAERVGPGGRVISTDLAPGMVDAARRRADTLGLTNVECRVMDAQRMDLPDDSVDVVISRLGFMLMPDPAAAFGEVRRVLKPGGGLAYAVIGEPDRNAWMSLIVMAFVSRGHLPEGGDPFGAGGPFSLAAAQRNVELLEAAGFATVDVDDVDGTFPFADVEDHWQFQLAVAGPVADLAASVDPDELVEVKETLATSMEPHRTSDGYRLGSHLVAVIAS